MTAEFFLVIPQKTPFVTLGAGSYPVNRVLTHRVKERVMNSKKAVMMGCVLTLTAVPAIGMAKSERAGLNACAEAMMSDLAVVEETTREYRVKNLRPSAGRRLHMTNTIHLDARGAESNEVLARYDCTVNSRAEVIELTVLPIEADDASDRALTMQ